MYWHFFYIYYGIIDVKCDVFYIGYAYNRCKKEMQVTLDVQTPWSDLKNDTFQFCEDKKRTQNFTGTNYEYFHIYEGE